MSRFARILKILRAVQEVLGIAIVTIDIVHPMTTQVFQDPPKVPSLPQSPKQLLKQELQRGLEDLTEVPDEDLDVFLRR